MYKYQDDPFAVGFDRIFNRLHSLNELQTKQGNYPPYNIIKRGEDRYEVEIATAGFLEGEISIEVADGVMTVEGKKQASEVQHEYVHKGIAERDFVRKFTLADTIQVRGAEMANGILTIVLENVIPEHKKPRKIEIGRSAMEFLTEDK